MLPKIEDWVGAFCYKYHMSDLYEDFINEAVVIALNSIKKAKKGGTFYHFMRICIVNGLISHIRHNVIRNHERLTIFNEPTTDSALDMAGRLYNACESNEDKALVQACLYGDTKQEIAKYLGISQREAKRRMERLINAKRLRRRPTTHRGLEDPDQGSGEQ
jgi:DNA-directed RNA polymerase specialized sigma24 family protein